MNERANLKAIAGVRCSEDIYNSHERGWSELHSSSSSSSSNRNGDLPEKERHSGGLGWLGCSCGCSNCRVDQPFSFWCNNEQREETWNRVTMPSEIKLNDRCKSVRREWLHAGINSRRSIDVLDKNAPSRCYQWMCRNELGRPVPSNPSKETFFFAKIYKRDAILHLSLSATVRYVHCSRRMSRSSVGDAFLICIRYAWHWSM